MSGINARPATVFRRHQHLFKRQIPHQFRQRVQPLFRFFYKRVCRIPRIARENGGNHAADFGRAVGCVHHVLETVVVPAVHIGAKSVYAHHQRLGELALPVCRFAFELAGKQVSGEFGGMQRDGYAR